MKGSGLGVPQAPRKRSKALRVTVGLQKLDQCQGKNRETCGEAKREGGTGGGRLLLDVRGLLGTG